MERIQIFKQILETEETARIIYDEAMGHKEGLAKYLDETIEARRKEAYAEAEAEIARAEARAVADADAAIASQDERTAAQLAAVRDAYTHSRDSLVENFFHAAIHRTGEGAEK